MTAIPIEGDRAAFDSVNYPAVHASDLEAGTPVQHNPTGASVGDAPVWDGAKWVATAVASAVYAHIHVYNEDLTSQVTGGGVTDFLTTYAILTGTLQFYLNGVRRMPDDLTVLENEITTSFTVTTPDEVLVDYIVDESESV